MGLVLTRLELPCNCYGATLWNYVPLVYLWSYAHGLVHVEVKPSQQGRALTSDLLDIPSLMAWEEGYLLLQLVGRWCAYFYNLAFC